MKLAPVVLFVYNRPEHTRKTLEHLSRNKFAAESELIVFADGPKENAGEEELTKIEAVRSVVNEKNWCGAIKLVASEKNKGLANSVIEGVTEIVNEYGRVIVLEDDLVSSPYFLEFMNASLEQYANDEKVIGIAAYIYPVRTALPETFFLRGADCWGWATWKRGWDLFEKDGKKLLDEIESKKLAEDFDFGNAYPYTQMLRDQVNGLNSSWAIRWYASAYLQNKLSLYPGETLIQNIGVDGSGTHSGISDKWEGRMAKKCPAVGAIAVEENPQARAAIAQFFWELRMIPFDRRVKSWLRRLLGK